jgi:hypothetical protein
MSFNLPQFNLHCNVWHAPAIPPVGAPDLDTLGNLAWGRRVNVTSTGGTSFLGTPLLCMTLLLPKLTDVRGDPAGGADVVEVPAGSGRFYRIVFVDDIGKGFANEHRAAVLQQHLPMPVPMP